MMRLCFIVLCLILQGTFAEILSQSPPDESESDPALKEFSFDIGYGTEYFTAYVQPNIQAFSSGKHENIMEPSMRGHAVKFFNMSTKVVRLYWIADNGEPMPMSKVPPFHATGSASFPGHNFIFASIDDDNNDKKIPLIHFKVEKKIVFYYDPFHVPNNKELTKKNLATLSYKEYEKYDKLRRNRLFGEKYEEFTGREYISMYPRVSPQHKMWRADFFGQKHWITTKETHFKEVPALAKKKIEVFGEHRELKDEPRALSEYRTGDDYLNMTLKVLSCAPRVFEIQDFLSEAEVDHILHLAAVMGMKLSSTSDVGDEVLEKKKTRTRTSFNTWVERETDTVIDSIYRRAADLLRIDEKLFRHRGHTSHEKSISEALQLVHYDIRQEYTAHHDFGYAGVEDLAQPTRFSTLLLYLNEDMTGGETEFPRWVNGDTTNGLKVTPKKGKAVLFYSFLPDGNLDDLSQHSANPIVTGEKFLINLWTWDPIRRD